MQELDCGFDCFYNIRNNEIVTIPNFRQSMDEDEFRGAFKAGLDKLKKNKADFIKFEVLDSFESFKIMERFVGELNDEKLQLELENVLVNKNHFRILSILLTIQILDKVGLILNKMNSKKE